MAPKSLQIRSRARLGASWRFLALLRLSGPLLAPLGALLAPLGRSSGALGATLPRTKNLAIVEREAR